MPNQTPRRLLVAGAGLTVAAAIPHPENWPDRGLFAAWLGHSSVLLKIDGYTILTDPVLGNRIGVSVGAVTVGPKRLAAPALRRAALPKIDLILLSHAHMDHMDLPTLRSLEDSGARVVTAPNTSELFRASRFGHVTELAWDARVQTGPVNLRALRVNHWGARFRTDTYRGFNGYLLEAGRYRVLFAGDTADMSHFRHLKTQRGIDLAIMPVGAYNPWIRYHCTPEQAWRMAGEAGAEFVLPVHHQTFRLSREPHEEPIERLHAAAGAHPDRIALTAIGQEFRLA